jgi:hypothetical protein
MDSGERAGKRASFNGAAERDGSCVTATHNSKGVIPNEERDLTIGVKSTEGN